MNNIKNIISEEIKYLIKEYTNNNLGMKLNQVVENLENVTNEIVNDVNNRVKQGDTTVSKRESIIESLVNNTMNLRKISNVINRNNKL